jgi:murein L,D-transpeptidase YcbB/YkuD
VYDETLAAAVRRFQARHGIDADGVIGAGTIAALNVPLSGSSDKFMSGAVKVVELEEEEAFIAIAVR